MRPTQDPDLVPDLPEVVARDGLLRPGERLLVAVSGGADSSALASLLHRAAAHGLPLDLTLAHLDHGWRGREAAQRDEARVRALATELDLPLQVAGPPPDPCASEARARRWRYAQLARLATGVEATTIATGHHRGDQAETVLMRLRRGSGPHGLQGMRRQRPLGSGALRLVRPLLDVPPAALRAWLRGAGIPWVEDPTNLDPVRDRARARLDLADDPDLEGRLLAAASRIAVRMDQRRRRVLERLDGALFVPPGAGALRVERAALRALGGPLREVAFRWLGASVGAEREGPFLTRRHLALLDRAIASGGAVELRHGTAVRVGTRHVWIHAPTAPREEDLPRIEVTRHRRASFDLDAFRESRRSDVVALDAGALDPELRLRLARATDAFEPHGSPSSSRALYPWLTAQGVPAWLRPRTAVLEGRGGIVWVPGYREASHALVGVRTTDVAVLRLERGPGALRALHDEWGYAP